MKISFPLFDREIGPYLFCNKLRDTLAKYSDIEICNESRCDISFNVIDTICNIKGVKNVLRLDGIYHNIKENYERRNRRIKSSFVHSDGIVYQSKFSKRLCEGFLGPTKKVHCIIYNGDNPERFPKDMCPEDFNCSHMFFTASLWRPFKRLRDVIESFILADIKDSKLFIAGDTNKSGLSVQEIYDYHRKGNIFFLSHISGETLLRFYSGCTGFIHLSWIDNCPNCVVEAICANKPVICSNSSGTKEIVKPSGGIVLDIDGTYKIEAKDTNNPPPIDRVKVAKAIALLCNRKHKISSDHVNIYKIAKSYYRFFRKILYG